ncbi:MAG: very short patch repair endonuclease [Chitinispirillales bacterium]|nr:very short patch repair endonuclease [Chitinispirillales bacterium]
MDHLSKEKRSLNMSKIRSKDTLPEISSVRPYCT